jgi:translation initiation factor 3 subunit D
MCAPRSVYPWDIVINRVGNKLFFDKRNNGVYGMYIYIYIYIRLFLISTHWFIILIFFLILDYITVNENATDPPLETSDKDNINSPSALALEATDINHFFAMQVVNEV